MSTEVIRAPRVEIRDEGTTQGQARAIDFTGSGVSVSVSAGVATVVVSSGGGGSFSMTETEIDFGTTPQWDKTFTVVDASVTGSSKISVWPSGNVGTSRVGNDLEWDNLLLGALAGTGQFTLTALAFPGPVVGKRKIYYAIA